MLLVKIALIMMGLPALLSFARTILDTDGAYAAAGYSIRRIVFSLLVDIVWLYISVFALATVCYG